MNMVGLPEFMVVLIIVFFWVVPIAASIWALVTLQRIRAGQQVVQLKLDAIERLLQR